MGLVKFGSNHMKKFAIAFLFVDFLSNFSTVHACEYRAAVIESSFPSGCSEIESKSDNYLQHDKQGILADLTNPSWRDFYSTCSTKSSSFKIAGSKESDWLSLPEISPNEQPYLFFSFYGMPTNGCSLGKCEKIFLKKYQYTSCNIFGDAAGTQTCADVTMNLENRRTAKIKIVKFQCE